MVTVMSNAAITDWYPEAFSIQEIPWTVLLSSWDKMTARGHGVKEQAKTLHFFPVICNSHHVYSKSSHGLECSCVVGINAGVMFLQPNQWVFNDMLAELSEPNHPEHCVGNGPEQET